MSAVKLGEALKVREVAEGKGSDEQKGCLMPSEVKYITQLIWHMAVPQISLTFEAVQFG